MRVPAPSPMYAVGFINAYINASVCPSFPDALIALSTLSLFTLLYPFLMSPLIIPNSGFALSAICAPNAVIDIPPGILGPVPQHSRLFSMRSDQNR